MCWLYHAPCGRGHHDHMVLGFTTTCEVSVITNVVIWNAAHGKVYCIQPYVIKFVSDLQQDGCFLRVLQFPRPIKLTAMSKYN